MAVDGKAIRAKDIEYYCDETFFSALEKWFYTKLWGLAQPGGWACQPLDYLDAITAIESENNLIENEELQEKSGKAKVSDAKDSVKKAPGL